MSAVASPPLAAPDEPIVRVRGLVNRFGEQVVHDGLDLEVVPRRDSSASSAVRAPASRC